MYHVSAHGVDERMINVHYYYFHSLLLLFFLCLLLIFIFIINLLLLYLLLVVVDCFYIMLFSTLEQTHCTHIKF